MHLSPKKKGQKDILINLNTYPAWFFVGFLLDMC